MNKWINEWMNIKGRRGTRRRGRQEEEDKKIRRRGWRVLTSHRIFMEGEISRVIMLIITEGKTHTIGWPIL